MFITEIGQISKQFFVGRAVTEPEMIYRGTEISAFNIIGRGLVFAGYELCVEIPRGFSVGVKYAPSFIRCFLIISAIRDGKPGACGEQFYRGDITDCPDIDRLLEDLTALAKEIKAAL